MRVLTVLTLGLTLDRFSNVAAGVLPSRNTEYRGKTDRHRLWPNIQHRARHPANQVAVTELCTEGSEGQ